jgi:hypothetical protein
VWDEWAFYQTKNVRAEVLASEADTLASLPNAQDPMVQARIKDVQANASRVRDNA